MGTYCGILCDCTYCGILCDWSSVVFSSYIQNGCIQGKDLEKIAFHNLFYLSKANDLFERKSFIKYIIVLYICVF